MIRVSRTIECAADDVWEVLADGWLYPLWVVGASRIREVDEGWPAAGSALHHSFGAWPAVVDDTTEVVECRAREVLRLRARGNPVGEAAVQIFLEPHGDATRVHLDEDVARGPARLVPVAVRRPLVRYRNTESLVRLAWLAERRSAR